MYFNVRGTEEFLGRRVGARYVALLLFALVIHMLTREMKFENANFYVRGESHFYWGAMWMLFFLYWNSIHFFLWKKLPDQLKKLNLKVPFYSLNISFFLAAFYSYGFGLYQNIVGIENIGNFCGGILSNFEIVFDAPSIWCVFASLQGFFIYRLGGALMDLKKRVDYKGEIPFKKSIIVSLIIWGAIFLTLPMFSALSYKMILK